MLIYNILKKYIDMIDWERGIFSYYSMMVFKNYLLCDFIRIMPIPVKFNFVPIKVYSILNNYLGIVYVIGIIEK